MEHPKILAIDDLADNLIVLEALLNETFPKAKILKAQSGTSGIQKCITERPDVVLLDIIMPGMDGFEVCRYLKSNKDTAIIPVIMVTASKSNTDFKITALDAGADAFLTKPFDSSELTAQIRAMLRIKEAEDLKLDEKQRLKNLVEEKTFALQKELKERKMAEAALKESESQFREFFEKAADAIFIADIETGMIVDVNEAATRLMKTSYEQLIGIHQSLLHPPVKRSFSENSFNKHKELARKKISSHAIENMVLRSDGIEVPVEILASEVEYHGKRCLMGTFRDISERKKAEKNLKERESLLRTLIESAPFEIWARDKNEIGILENKNLVRHFGSILGKLPENPYTPTPISQHWKSNNQRALNGEIISNECIYVVDGVERTFHQILAPIIVDGSVEGITGFNIDITELQKAAEMLRLSEERLRLISDSSLDIICSYDLQSRFTSANRTLCAALKLSEEEIIGKTHEELHFPEAQCQEWAALHQQVIESGHSVFSESKTPMPDGSEHIYEIALNPLHDSEKKIVGIGVVIRDVTERKIAEEKIKENYELFECLFNSSPDAIVIVDPHTHADYWPIVDCNKATCQMNGYTREELIGQPVDILNARTDTNDGRTEYLEKLRQNGFNKLELLHRHKDGHFFPVEVLTTIVSVGGRELVLGIDRDITERKKAEAELSKQRQRLEGVLEGTNAGTWNWNIQTGEEIHNQRWAEIIGYQLEELENDGFKVWKSTVHPDDFSKAYDQLNKLINNEIEFYNVEFRQLHKNGEWVWVNSRGKVVERDHEGNVLWVSGTHLDVTERKNAEIALQQSQSTLRGILESFPGELFWKDLDLNYLGCNKAFSVSAQLSGSDEIVGKNDFELPWANSSAELYRSMDRKVIETGISFHNLISSQINADGKLVWLDTSKLPLTDAEGKVFGILGVSHDITDFKEVEQSLLASIELNNSLLHTIPFGMDIVDEFGTILFQNENLEKLFGNRAIGQKCWELYRDDKTQCSDCPLRAGIQIGQTDLIEIKDALEGRIFQISHTGMMFQGKKAMLEIFQDVTEKRKAEKELEEINQRFSNLVETTDGIVWEADAETFVFNFVSKNAERLLGYQEHEWYEPNFWKDHIYLEDQEKTVSFCVAQTQLISDHNFEYRFVSKTGKVVWLADYVKVISENGKPCKLNGLMVNITERKLMELTLQESEDRYRRFISQVSEGVYRFESDQPIDISLPVEEQIDLIYDHMHVAECNKAFCEMYGISDDNEMIGKSHLEFHGGRDNPLNRQALRDFIKDGYRVQNAITQERNKNGHVVYFSNNSIGIIENNRLVRLWGTQSDITDKTRADQIQQVLYTISNASLSTKDLPELIELISHELGKLLDSTNFYIAFYDEKEDLLSTIYEKDEKDILMSWPASKSVTGYVIRNKQSLLIDDAGIKKLCEAGEIEIFGSMAKVWLGVPLLSENKAVGALVVQSYDTPDAYTEKDKQMLEFISHQISISLERKQAEQEIKDALAKAQESDRLKSAFLANMSHEIRTPLNSIIGFSELIRDPAFEPEQQDEFAQLINESGNNLLSILSDIMDISKIEAGQIVIKKQQISVNQLVSSLHREFSRKADKKGIRFWLDPTNPDEEILIESDEIRIRQIISNFLGNAIKFTSEGHVELGVKATEDYVQFQVKDTGIGIPEVFHEKIFERFRQVETSHTRKYGGNGLGLSICKSLVELLGGTIGMESEEGKGSTFYFRLPRSNE